MGTLIDTSILIAAERGKLEWQEVLATQADESIAIAAITASELLHGVHRAASAAQRAKRQAFVEHLLAELPVMPFDLLAARIHASIWAQLASQGKSIGAHDLIIGATALALNFSVATRDERSFPKIPGLTLKTW